MSYRTFKRALGDTNIERKCRVLFGICLAVLIAAAFWWVDTNAQTVVLEATRTEGRNLATNYLLKKHWRDWDTDPIPEETEMLNDMIRGFEAGQKYDTEILGLDSIPLMALDSTIPTDPAELKLLRRLKQLYEEEADALSNAAEPEDEIEGQLPAMAAAVDNLPVFQELPLPEKNEYHYYQPIYWNNNCTRLCHLPVADTGAFSTLDSSSEYTMNYPFRAIKVIIPYENTKDAIARARGGLFAAAIATVFLAMVALYIIVRYVIVKPLQHLRDVSDEISRGQTDLRAEIHTNDEFEELADAFNRMLRHLIAAQGELRNVNKDLDAKVDELAQLNMRLYEMNRLKSDFLANMSHELRTPLNSIIGFSEVLQGIDSLTDKQKRYAQNIQKSGRVLLEMINDILDLAKLEAGKMEVRPTEFRIDAVVSAQCDMVRSLTEEKNIDLEVHVPANSPPIFQDQSKVQQILTNLLSNAIKFTPEGGRITVSARRTHLEKLELSVSDTGVGIPEEDSEVIFEKFRQSETVLGTDGLTREYSGTGLGLSIVKELCKLLHGEITFESELGMGSTFTVVLPCTLPGRASTESAKKLAELTQPSREQFGIKDTSVTSVAAGD